jgi:hypothetical protein
MKLIIGRATFGQHDTFPLRYGWMTKGIEVLRGDKTAFAHVESAMMRLGIGSNMVKALQYWMRVTGVAEFEGGEGSVTPLGLALFGENGDPYLEDEATIWILHWLIASNAELATGFFWFFNRYNSPRFQDKDLLRALADFVQHDLKTVRSESTLKSDFSTLLRMYAPVAARADEHLDSPFSQLQVVERYDRHNYQSLRTARPYLPAAAMHFALQARFDAHPGNVGIPVSDLLNDKNYACPGAVFRLSEDGLMGALAQTIEAYPKCYDLRETSGLHQIMRLRSFTPVAILENYYQKAMQ